MKTLIARTFTLLSIIFQKRRISKFKQLFQTWRTVYADGRNGQKLFNWQAAHLQSFSLSYKKAVKTWSSDKEAFSYHNKDIWVSLSTWKKNRLGYSKWSSKDSNDSFYIIQNTLLPLFAINHQCVFKNKSTIELQVCYLWIKWLRPTFSLSVRLIYCNLTSRQSGKAGSLRFQTINHSTIKVKTSSIQAPTQNQKTKANNKCWLILKISLNLMDSTCKISKISISPFRNLF